MKTYEQTLAEDRRLVILLILAQSAGYCCNEFLLQQLLEARGHIVSEDKLRTDLAWLQEQELLHVAEIADTQIATVNRRGLEVSEGRAQVPGVKRPRAGA